MRPIILLTFIGLLLAGLARPEALQSRTGPEFALGDNVSAPPNETDLAPVILLVDMGTGQTLYAKNAERRFVPASVTKVMTAYTAFEMIERGELDMRQTLRFDRELFRAWRRRGSTMYLAADEEVPVGMLLRGILTVSANDGSALLAKGAAGSVEEWTKRMNGEAASLGMRDSRFASPNGFPDEGRTYTSARDLIVLAQAIVTAHPEKYAALFGHKTLTWNGISQDNYDPLIGEFAGADGMKTGFTNEAGFTYLGSAKRNGRRLGLVIAGAESARHRAELARAMMEWGFSAWQPRRLYGASQKVGSARVQQGSALSVPLLAPRDYQVNLPTASDGDVELRLAYRGPLVAPIRKGETVARLQIYVDGERVQSAPLVAGEDVAEAGALGRLRNGLIGLVR